MLNRRVFLGGSLPLNAFATLEGERTLAPLFGAAQKLGSFFTDYGVGGGARGDTQPALDTLAKTLDAAQRQRIYFDNTRELLASKGIA